MRGSLQSKSRSFGATPTAKVNNFEPECQQCVLALRLRTNAPTFQRGRPEAGTARLRFFGGLGHTHHDGCVPVGQNFCGPTPEANMINWRKTAIIGLTLVVAAAIAQPNLTGHGLPLNK